MNCISVTPILGHQVALEVLQCIGYFRALREAYIISYNMQDYDFWGNGRLSSLLRRQLANGAEVTLMTTPPPGKGDNDAFKDKFTLLKELDRNGVQVFLHSMLHAKAYVFLDGKQKRTTIVGSANLTHHGFGLTQMPEKSYLELALTTTDPDVQRRTINVIRDKLIGDTKTEDFATWVAKNTERIALAKGGIKDE